MMGYLYRLNINVSFAPILFPNVVNSSDVKMLTSVPFLFCTIKVDLEIRTTKGYCTFPMRF